MAEIHLLPSTLEPATLSRTYEALRRAFEAGQDLGDRSHHLRVIRAGLEATLQDLRQQIEELRRSSSYPPGFDVEALARNLDAWLQAIASLAAAVDPAELRTG